MTYPSRQASVTPTSISLPFIQVVPFQQSVPGPGPGPALPDKAQESVSVPPASTHLVRVTLSVRLLQRQLSP